MSVFLRPGVRFFLFFLKHCIIRCTHGCVRLQVTGEGYFCGLATCGSLRSSTSHQLQILRQTNKQRRTNKQTTYQTNKQPVGALDQVQPTSFKHWDKQTTQKNKQTKKNIHPNKQTTSGSFGSSSAFCVLKKKCSMLGARQCEKLS